MSFGKMDNRNHIVYYLILFLISPVLSVIAAMANFKNKNARVTLILFVAAFGFTIIMRPGSDGSRQAMNFAEYWQLMSFDQFQYLISEIITLNGGKHLGSHADELYLPILSYTLAQFTANPSWLFFTAGLVYGYFFIRGISLVYSDMHRNWNIVLLILFIFFITWKNLEGLNSIRNWTGAWCFFNGAYLYLKTRNINYILLVMLAPMFHAAYLVITLPFYAYLVIGDRKYVLMGILIFTYLFSTSSELIEPYLAGTGLGEAKIDAYVEDGEVGFAEEDNRSFHVRWYRFTSDLIIQGLFIYSMLFMGFMKGENHDPFRTRLAGFSILMLSLANLSGFAPVLQNRVFVNFGLYALAYLVLHYSQLSPLSGLRRNIVYIAFPGILLFMFTQYSQIGDFMDFKLLISPLLYPFVGDDPVSMKEFIRSFIL
jgi:hypothetical protein